MDLQLNEEGNRAYVGDPFGETPHRICTPLVVCKTAKKQRIGANDE